MKLTMVSALLLCVQSYRGPPGPSSALTGVARRPILCWMASVRPAFGLRALLAAILVSRPPGCGAQEWIRPRPGENRRVIEAMQSGQPAGGGGSRPSPGGGADPFVSDVVSALLGNGQHILVQFLLHEVFPPMRPPDIMRNKLAATHKHWTAWRQGSPASGRPCAGRRSACFGERARAPTTCRFSPWRRSWNAGCGSRRAIWRRRAGGAGPGGARIRGSRGTRISWTWCSGFRKPRATGRSPARPPRGPRVDSAPLALA